MKKLVAIALSILFCMTLTCCGTEDVLAGLPEIPRDERIYYNGTRVEKGEGLDEARPVTECPYDKQPTLDEAEADGAFIEWYNSETGETIIKNFSALERFVYNVNRGIEDSILRTSVTYKNGRESVVSNFLYYANGKLKNTYGFEKKLENTYADGDKINIFFYDSLSYDKGKGVRLLREYSPIDSSASSELFRYRTNFVELTEKSLFYEEGVTEKFVNVAGIYEGDGGDTKLYEKYPFEEAFPTAKQVFDIGGVVIFDKDFTTKVYNTAAILRFRENLRNGNEDTLFVYTDDGIPCIVMYSYTGKSLIISKDTRLKDTRSDVFTTEIFGDTIGLGNNSMKSDDLRILTCSERKNYMSFTFSIICNTEDNDGNITKHNIHEFYPIPEISYVTEHIVPESEAKNFK